MYYNTKVDSIKLYLQMHQFNVSPVVPQHISGCIEYIIMHILNNNDKARLSYMGSL